MRFPVQASLSAVSFVAALFSVGFSTHAQDLTRPVAKDVTRIDATPELRATLSGLEENLKIAVAAHDLKSQALALDRIGALYFTHQDAAQALKHFQQVLPIVRKLKERTAEATALSDIGAANFALGRAEDALDAFKLALPIWRSVGNKDHEAATLGDIGEVFRALNDQQEALHFDQLALPSTYSPAIPMERRQCSTISASSTTPPTTRKGRSTPSKWHVKSTEVPPTWRGKPRP